MGRRSDGQQLRRIQVDRRWAARSLLLTHLSACSLGIQVHSCQCRPGALLLHDAGTARLTRARLAAHHLAFVRALLESVTSLFAFVLWLLTYGKKVAKRDSTAQHGQHNVGSVMWRSVPRACTPSCQSPSSPPF